MSGQITLKENTPRLIPEDQFPKQAINDSVQVQPKATEGMGWQGSLFTIGLASSADSITQWGRDVRRRDQQLRDFWPTESYLAGAVANVSFRNAAFDWSIKHPSPLVAKAVENMLKRAMAGDSFGWNNFINKFSQDLYCLYGRSTITLGGDRYGKRKSIQEIVDEKDEGPVLTIQKNGQIIERKIIQWEKTPLAGRSWVWLSLLESSTHSGKNKGGLWITEDHPVLTNTGWVNAGDVKVGMAVASGHPRVNKKQEELLAGMLLGDASISIPGRNAQIKISHSIAQEKYMNLKMGAFGGMVWTPVNGNRIKQANSQVSFTLNKWREIWYPNGKKIVPREMIEQLFSPLLLATWYMDDGSIAKNKTKNGTPTNPGVFLSTQGFTKEDNEWLVELLGKNGIGASVHEVKLRGKTYYRIYIGTEGAHVLFLMISQYVPNYLRYKLPAGYKDFDENCWELGNVETAFDLVVAAEKKPLKTGRGGVVQTTYHIGVEETRNFIANNVVVHNTQDNGAFIEVIREPGADANSKFTGARAPVVGIAHLDSGQCTRTGNAEFPVIYTDRNGERHKLAWYEVIPFSEFPSAIEKMNGVGYCAVTRALRLAQIMRSVLLFKDEEVSGTNTKKIQIVGGVGRTQIEDAVKRTLENASNGGRQRYVEHAVLASLDPEKPVSVATVDLAGLPEDFNFDTEMQWYIAGLALDFGVDYQDFAPLSGGGVGSGDQSNMLNRKSSGKGPRNWMDSLANSFTFYGVLPRGADMIFNDKNEQEEMERQKVRTGAVEEAAIAVNSKILTPEAALKSLVRRGIYDEEDTKNIPDDWWQNALDQAKNEAKGQMVGARGGNTLAEDAGRTNSGKPNLTGSDRLRKMISGEWFRK